jgi:peptidoglycan/LPS O-acetylase OafA/YrhL
MPDLLSRRASGRDNNFNLIRFLAAALVLYSHAWPLTGTPGEPLEKLAGFSLGHLAVDVFFVVSGFLVTGSLLGRGRLGAFLRARALRIFPALLVSSVLAAFAIGALQTHLPLAAYFRAPGTWAFAAQDATCWPWPIVYGLPGVFAHVPYPNVVNGSLWSLPFELDMYAALALAGLLAFAGPRLLSERWLRAGVLAVAAIAILAYTGNEVWNYAPGFTKRQGIRLSALFATGASFHVLRERIRLSAPGIVAALVGLAVALLRGHAWMALYPVSLEYAVLWLAFVPAGFLRGYNALGDYSYGFYLWAFPVQQCVMAWRPGTSRLALTALAIPPTLALAVLSWHLLESPMLALKDRGRALRARRTAVAAAPGAEASQTPDATGDRTG